MLSVIDILEQLESTSGSNDKKALLTKHSSNTLLKDVFVAAGNPYVVYNVVKFDMPEARDMLSSDDDMIYSFLYEILPRLSSRDLTGNAAKEFLSDQFEDMDERQQKWCHRILLKNMRCGVDTTVNKVWKDAVPTFDIQLAKPLKTEYVKGEGIKILDKIAYPVWADPKLDGLRCLSIKESGVVTMYTRTGHEIDTLPAIKVALEQAPYDNMVLDAEAIGITWNDSNSVIMAKKTKKDDSEMVYNVFDAISLSEWKAQKSTMPFSKRTELAASIVKAMPNNAPVKYVQGKVINNEKELLQFYSECLKLRYEGIMIKKLSSVYKFKRSDDVTKLKPFISLEGCITGWVKGKVGGKHEDKFAGFSIVFPDSNGITTDVGSGFTDEMRSKIQKNPDSFIGKIAEIEGQPDIENASGLTKDLKLRFPVFSRFRDKSDVDPRVLETYERYLILGGEGIF